MIDYISLHRCLYQEPERNCGEEGGRIRGGECVYQWLSEGDLSGCAYVLSSFGFLSELPFTLIFQNETGVYEPNHECMSGVPVPLASRGTMLLIKFA